MSPEERIVFPLDTGDLKEAVEWAKRLKDFVGVFKIGSILFCGAGPRSIERIKKAGARKIFLDLKLNDIPNTVGETVKILSEYGVDWLTVHILAGEKALKEAVKNARNNLKIIGVTLLTSLDRADLMELGFNGELIREFPELVFRLATLGIYSGCEGIVCSAREVSRIKEAFPQVFTVVPGIRLEEKQDDQIRITTPFEAIKEGADYLVIGRPIREAEEPEKVCEEIINQVKEALEEKGDD